MKCAFCAGRRMYEVLDFGDEALAGGFLKREQFAAEQRYPLRLMFCEDCFAVQIADRVSPEVLFREYRYFASATATARAHFARYAEDVLERFQPKTVLEIGCNDGVLLQHLAGKAERVIGVDPAENVTRGIRDPRIGVVNDFFNEDTAQRVREVYGKADLIVANNVFAHVEDINGVTRAVRDTLTDHGVFVFEVHHLGKMIEDLQYDWVYHEHFYYYSLLALDKHLARHGMMIFDVEEVELHAGSRRFYACKDVRHVTHRVGDLRGIERIQGLHSVNVYQRFAERVQAHSKRLRRVLKDLRDEGKVVGGYGASGRANALIQHADIGEFLHCMFDDAPARAGMFTPGSHLHINEGRTLRGSSTPDYLVVFAWSYLDEILPKCDGRGVIVPFPDIRVRTPLGVAA